MLSFSEATLLRIYTSEMDRFEGKPFYESVVTKAREMGLSGATVLRGGLGYGHDSLIHTSKILDLSEDLPLVIELVDKKEKIQAFLPVLDGMMETGIVTTETVHVRRYGKDKSGD